MEYRAIKGYEDIYVVSEYGDVLRIKKYLNSKDTPLVQYLTKDGYMQVTLCKNNIKQSYRVHRLVAEAFVPKLKGKNIVNHKDENKLNNHYSNLEWCDEKYNTNYGCGIEKRASKRRKKVIAYNEKENIVYSSITEASKSLKINHANIVGCLTKKRKSAGGYKWRYAETKA